MPDFYPDIQEYLTEYVGKDSPTSKNLEDIVLKTRALTGLDKDLIEKIISLYFREIKSLILDDNIVTINPIGSFKLSRSKRIVNFHANPTFLKKIKKFYE